MPHVFNKNDTYENLKAFAMQRYANANLHNLQQSDNEIIVAAALLRKILSKCKNWNVLGAELNNQQLQQTHPFYLAELASAFASIRRRKPQVFAKYLAIAVICYNNLLPIISPDPNFSKTINEKLGKCIKNLVNKCHEYASNLLVSLPRSTLAFTLIECELQSVQANHVQLTSPSLQCETTHTNTTAINTHEPLDESRPHDTQEPTTKNTNPSSIRLIDRLKYNPYNLDPTDVNTNRNCFWSQQPAHQGAQNSVRP